MAIDPTQLNANLTAVSTEFHAQFDGAGVPEYVAWFDSTFATLTSQVDNFVASVNNQQGA